MAAGDVRVLRALDPAERYLWILGESHLFYRFARTATFAATDAGIESPSGGGSPSRRRT